MTSGFEYCLFLVCFVFVSAVLYLTELTAGPLPSIFGLHIATYILCELAEKPISNPLAIKNRRKLYERLLRDLLNRESKLSGQPIKCIL
jgi:peptidoglycan/LPS O-acetylase OafA/YrhL